MKTKVLVLIIFVMLTMSMKSYSQINAAQFCRSWVVKTYDEKQQLTVYEPFSKQNHDSTKTYTVITFNTDGTVSTTSHYAFDNDFSALNCGVHNFTTIESNWQIKKNKLIWYTKSSDKATSAIRESIYEFEIVELNDSVLSHKYINSDIKHF